MVYCLSPALQTSKPLKVRFGLDEETSEGMMSSEQTSTSKSVVRRYSTGTAGEMLPVVHGLDTAMSPSAL